MRAQASRSPSSSLGAVAQGQALNGLGQVDCEASPGLGFTGVTGFNGSLDFGSIIWWRNMTMKNHHVQWVYQLKRNITMENHNVCKVGIATITYHNYGKSPCRMGISIISMAIFHSYVKLPEVVIWWWIHLFERVLTCWSLGWTIECLQ